MDNFNFEQLMDRMYANTASNNWRKMHGYPLRRKSANRWYKLQKKQKHQPMTLGASGAGKSRYWIMPDLSKHQVEAIQR